MKLIQERPKLNHPKRYIFALALVIFSPLLLMGWLKVNSFYKDHYVQTNVPVNIAFKPIFEIRDKEKEIQEKVIEATKPAIPANESANDKVIRLVKEKFGAEADKTLLLLQGESGIKDSDTEVWVYRYWAVNQSSGACGLFQALPCEKMPCGITPADIECQIDWGKTYIENRYGTSTDAHEFWLAQAPHWY